MLRAQILLVYLLLTYGVKAQFMCLELNDAQVHQFAESSKTATLFVVINNEKDPADAAIVNAVKKYWKVTPFKFMAKAEFVDLRMKKELKQGQLYLYEWFTDLNIVADNALLITEFLNRENTGFFHLSLATTPAPIASKKKSKNTSTAETQLLNASFDLSSTLASKKAKILDGYFDLMVKYFNHEIEFCRTFTDFKAVKKENKDGYVYFENGLTEVQSKNILLVKEQVQKSDKKEKKGSKKIQPSDAVAQFNPPSKNVMTVFPEDIKMALDKSDKQVLIYSNNMLLCAENGAVVAAPASTGESNQKPDYGFLMAAWGVFVLAFGLGFILR